MTDLNLAGVDPLPEPPFALPAGDTLNAPTFTEPHMAFPPLSKGDIAGAGIDYHAPYAIDPAVPDLSEYSHPDGLNIIAPPIDPMLPDLLDVDRPSDLLFPDASTVDPSLPSLQYPELTPQVTMDSRPGELADSAMELLHTSTDYQQLPEEETYKTSFMLQPGSTHRTRHLGMLELGLDGKVL